MNLALSQSKRGAAGASLLAAPLLLCRSGTHLFRGKWSGIAVTTMPGQSISLLLTIVEIEIAESGTYPWETHTSPGTVDRARDYFMARLAKAHPQEKRECPSAQGVGKTARDRWFPGTKMPYVGHQENVVVPF